MNLPLETPLKEQGLSTSKHLHFALLNMFCEKGVDMVIKKLLSSK